MSSTCNLLDIPSPTSTQQSSTGDAPRSIPQFPKPSLTPTRKLKAVLAHLAPPRLLRPSPIKPAKPPSRHISSAALSSSSALATHLPCGFPPIDASNICAESSLDSGVPLDASVSTETTNSAIADDNPLRVSCDSFPFSLDVANDVEKLLHIFQETPLSDDTNKRKLALGVLCALCISSPNNAKRCVVAGGVEMIIDALNCTAHPSPHAAGAIFVEESEKALLLLQVLTSSSEDGCIAALRHSSAIIATLGKKLLRVSESCTAATIAVLTALCRRSDADLFRNAISETAIPSKLVVVLQVACKDSTKRRAGRLLRFLAEQHQYSG